VLHLYIETKNLMSPEEVRKRVHESLREMNPFYADYEGFIQKKALEVTVLAPGTFSAYQIEKASSGADLAHLKPAHMNASDEVIEQLIRLSEQIA
jgi:hypothetical protein